MKTFIIKILYNCFMIGSCLIILSCVNSINDDEKTLPIIGDIPIKISAKKLHTQIYKEGSDDAIGIYILVSPTPLDKERYIENIRFDCTSSGFTPKEEIYYPAAKGKCDFISYYPYQESGIMTGATNMPITIQTDQRSLHDYNSSDFMTAEINNITSGKANVDLSYIHRLSQLSISITPSSDSDIKSLKTSNPRITLNNVPTQAIYDFDSQEITSLSNQQSLFPYGEWSILNGKLTGKNCMLMPHTIAANTEFMTLQINDKNYICQLAKNYQLESGTACEIELFYDAEKGINGIIPEISDWKQGNKSEVTPEEKEEKTFIEINDFNFEKSNIYTITSKGKIVAEVCKEYLSAKEIHAQAIVIYPVKNGICNWSNGTILQIIGAESPIHGGNVSWNIKTHQLTYIAGSQPPISGFYISDNYSISLTAPTTPLLLSIREKKLADGRGNETILYPIVKIGTQYWMRDDLKATIYTDGKKITLKTLSNSSKTTAGYFKKENNVFYNKKAVMTGKLAPVGWKIADESSWQQLNTYLEGDISSLKAINKLWEASECTATNLTGFNALPVGLYSKGADSDMSIYGFEKKYVAYWSMGNSSDTLFENGILLRFDSNEIKRAAYSDYCGYSIRCIQQ